MAYGSNCALKLLKNRKKYLKTKKGPFKTRPHIAKAIVLDHVEVEAKQPNSALRKCIKTEVIKTKEKRLAFIPRCGSKAFIKVHDIVTLQSMGGSKSRAKGDLTGMNYQVIKVNNVSLKQKFLRKK